MTDIAFPSDFCNNHSHPCVPVFDVPRPRPTRPHVPYLMSPSPSSRVSKSQSSQTRVPMSPSPSPVPVLYTAVYFVTLRQHLTEQYTILSGKREISMDSPTSMRNNSYLLTLQANFATICLMKKHTTPTLRELCSLFARKPGKSVDQSGHKINTVEPRLTKTSVIRSPRYYVHFFLAAQQNDHTFSCKNKTLVNTVTR